MPTKICQRDFKEVQHGRVQTNINTNESKGEICKEDGVAKIDEKLYRTLIGCLMYLTATRPDIMNATSILSRYMHCASEIHFQTAKRIVRYIN
jgi:hypothetical protein